MHALVGQQAPFDHGREQMQMLAGLTVTTKSVERIAEAIGGDLAQREQAEREKALPLELPVLGGDLIPVLYVQLERNRNPGGKERDCGSAGQERWSTGAYPGGQVRVCVHANQLEQARLCHP